jgi:hypothetical protein
LRFSKAKKELPLVAFFCQEKLQQSCKRLSTAIGAISCEFESCGLRVTGFKFQVFQSSSVPNKKSSVLFVFSVRKKTKIHLNQEIKSIQNLLIFAIQNLSSSVTQLLSNSKL